jgi:hypothetical protein
MFLEISMPFSGMAEFVFITLFFQNEEDILSMCIVMCKFAYLMFQYAIHGNRIYYFYFMQK